MVYAKRLPELQHCSSTLSKKLSASKEVAASEASAEVSKLLSDCIGEARNLARGLSPFGLDDLGLDIALESLAFNVQNLFRVSCVFVCDCDIPSIGRTTEQHLFRIAQQAVNNVLAHSNGDRIEICLALGQLSISDNGVGISDATITKEGLGLHTMRYRARLIGGSLTVGKRPDQGTEVICTFPLSDIADTVGNQNEGAAEMLKESLK